MHDKLDTIDAILLSFEEKKREISLRRQKIVDLANNINTTIPDLFDQLLTENRDKFSNHGLFFIPIKRYGDGETAEYEIGAFIKGEHDISPNTRKYRTLPSLLISISPDANYTITCSPYPGLPAFTPLTTTPEELCTPQFVRQVFSHFLAHSLGEI